MNTTQPTEQSVTGPYVERFYQSELHDGFENHRNSIVIAHRRAGKTVSVIAQLIRDTYACTLTRPQTAYIANTYKQAKNVAWAYFHDYLKHIPGVIFRQHDLTITLPGATNDQGPRTIYLLGSENPDRLRGMYLDAAAVDEMATAPESLITTILRPCLADRKGSLYLIGTVAGMNHFWRTYERAKVSDDWFTANLLPDYTNAIAADELKMLRREMSEEEYQSEMLNDPTAAVRGSYYGKTIQQIREAGQIKNVPYDEGLGVTLAFDLGIADATAIWAAQLHGAGEIRLIGYEEFKNTSFIDILRQVKQRSWNVIRWVGPHDLAVREFSSGQRRIDAAREVGVHFEIAPKLPVIEGIEACRRALPRCWFDQTACREGIDNLSLYRSQYDEKRRVLSLNPLHDYTSHCADSFRYLILATRGGQPDLFFEQPPLEYPEDQLANG